MRPNILKKNDADQRMYFYFAEKIDLGGMEYRLTDFELAKKKKIVFVIKPETIVPFD